MLRRFKKICRRCGGSGSLFRPLLTKVINYKTCTSCAGTGLK